jgi:hypothetical protein
VSITAFLTLNTECPVAAYGPYGGTGLRPSFADQTLARICNTLRSALFLRLEAARIRRVSLVTSELLAKSVGQNPT